MASTRAHEREAERRRQQRRAIRQEEALRKRKQRSAIGAALAVALVIGSIFTLVLINKDDNEAGPGAQPNTTITPTPTPTPSSTVIPDDPNAPPMTIDKTKTYTATIVTSEGTLTVDLDASKIPVTTNSWKFLADKKFWDGTKCHRMTSGGLNVLQCGDPEGTGSGGPGYTIGEENLEGATYEKGVIAMAKTQQPHSTGSQFFINYADSQLPPQYTPVGMVSDDSMDVLDKIKAIGVAGGAQDGAPAKEITITSIKVAQKK